MSFRLAGISRHPLEKIAGLLGTNWYDVPRQKPDGFSLEIESEAQLKDSGLYRLNGGRIDATKP